MSKLQTMLLIAGLSCVLPQTFASPIQLLVTGHITSSSFTSVPVGSVLTAYLSYDPSIPPFFVSTDGTNANYAAPMTEVVDIAGSELTSPPHPSSWDIFVTDNAPSPIWGVPSGDDGIVWVSSPSESGQIMSDPAFNSTGFDTFQIGFYAPSSSGPLNSVALPASFPGLSEWSTGYFYLIPVIGGTGGNFFGTIDSVQAVPEPTQGFFLTGAILSILLFRLRIRRAA